MFLFPSLSKHGFHFCCFKEQRSIIIIDCFTQIFLRTIFFRQRRLRRGVCVSDALHWEDVRLQEAREEEDQEEAGRDDGHHRKTNFAEDQFEICCQFGVCI